MDELMFAVFEVSTVQNPTPWADYTAAMAAAQAMKARLNAQWGDYTFVVEFYAGNPTPLQTKCATAFMDPSDRQYLDNGNGTSLIDGCTFITELQEANNDWAPPPEVIGLRAGNGVFVKASILTKECEHPHGHGHGHGHHGHRI